MKVFALGGLLRGFCRGFTELWVVWGLRKPTIPRSKTALLLLAAEAGPANTTPGAASAIGVVQAIVWHAPPRPRSYGFRDARIDDARIDEAVTSRFG